MHFVMRLLPPRPTFAETLTEHERAFMGQHGAYWREEAKRGTAVLFGLVLDPRAAWGLCVFEAPDEATARALVEGDPAVRAGLAFELLSIRVGMVRTGAAAAPSS